jgi:RNA polymerase sigma-70 factor, ECF subfamily
MISHRKGEDSMTDYHALLRRIAKKDDLAFAELYEATRTAVFSVLLAIVKNRMVAEDLMQDTYMKMIDALPDFQGKSAFKTWLIAIARHQAFDYLKKNHKTSQMDEGFVERIADETLRKPMDQLECEWLISTLDEEERQIVFLRVIEKMKHREIAALLSKPLGTILWIYQKAIAKMQTAGRENESEKTASQAAPSRKR